MTTPLVTVDYYRRITGDTSSLPGDVEEAILDAQQLIEEELRRPLVSAERTEAVQVIGMLGYPVVTPVTEADYDIVENGTAVKNPELDWNFVDYDYDPFAYSDNYWNRTALATITYTGGWTVATLPARLKEAIVRIAQRQLTPPTFDSTVPVGVKSSNVKNGDVSVAYTYGDDGAGAVGSIALGSVMSSIARYRRREP